MVQEYVTTRRREIRVVSGREPSNTFIPQEHLPRREAGVDFGEVAIRLHGELVAIRLPPTTPIICARQPPSPQYAPCPNFTLKLCRKNQKNLQKPVDKGHTTCYNNQAVSRAQPAAAAAGAFTYSLYAVF